MTRRPDNPKRGLRVNLLVSEQEKKMLEHLADGDRVSVSDWIRLSVREHYKERVRVPVS